MTFLKERSKCGVVDCVPLYEMISSLKSMSKLSSKMDNVKNECNKAMSLLSRSGYVHCGAIANECLGKYMLQHTDEFWAQHYLTHAVRLCSEWGAVVKVDQMMNACSFIDFDKSNSTLASSLLGRSRFNAAEYSMHESDPQLLVGTEEMSDRADSFSKGVVTMH